MASDPKSRKVPGSWLCPKGWGLRDAWNALQKANGTSQARHIPPSEQERQAWIYFDSHVTNCPDCTA